VLPGGRHLPPSPLLSALQRSFRRRKRPHTQRARCRSRRSATRCCPDLAMSSSRRSEVGFHYFALALFCKLLPLIASILFLLLLLSYLRIGRLLQIEARRSGIHPRRGRERRSSPEESDISVQAGKLILSYKLQALNFTSHCTKLH
jgi:hypothetical protein